MLKVTLIPSPHLGHMVVLAQHVSLTPDMLVCALDNGLTVRVVIDPYAMYVEGVRVERVRIQGYDPAKQAVCVKLPDAGRAWLEQVEVTPPRLLMVDYPAGAVEGYRVCEMTEVLFPVSRQAPMISITADPPVLTLPRRPQPALV